MPPPDTLASLEYAAATNSFGGRTHQAETEEELDALVDWDDDGTTLQRELRNLAP